MYNSSAMQYNNENTTIWKTLPRPFFVLAPMEEVTDSVFRQIVMKAGRPDLFFTEFTSVEGLMSRGRPRVIHRLQYLPKEKPVIAQIWGLDPLKYEQAAAIVADLGFEGIDINMGCPVDKVVKRGACSGLIRNPSLAGEIIDAVKRGSKGLPVSVKTRIGIKENQISDWISFLLSQKLAALTVHFRTVAEQSKVPAHWEEAPKVVELRNKIAPETVLIGNGDVLSVEQGKKLAAESGLEGIMVGRGIFHNPWIFSSDPTQIRTKNEKLNLMRDHVQLHLQTWGNTKNFHALKRFFKIYVVDFDGAPELRQKFMESNNHQEVLELLDEEII